MQRYIAMGARLILGGNDFSLMMDAARGQATAVRDMLA